MYNAPQLTRFGKFRDLTRSGCISGSDNVTFIGTTGATGVATGSLPDNDEPYAICLNTPGSR